MRIPSETFSPRIHVFAKSSDWFIALFSSAVIGQRTELPWFGFYGDLSFPKQGGQESWDSECDSDSNSDTRAGRERD